MAYKNTYSRRRRSRRYNRRSRNTIFNYGNPTIRMAAKALRTANYLRGLINVEFKRYDTVQTLSVLPTASQIINLSNITQGDEVNQRNGRTIMAKSSYLNGTLRLGDDIENCSFRYIIFYDKVSNLVAPTTDQILSYPTDIKSPLNPDYAGNRFIIIADKRFQMDQQNNPIQWTKVFRKLPNNHHLVWNGPTPLGQISGHLFMLVMARHTNVATLPVTFDYTHCIQYVDN